MSQEQLRDAFKLMKDGEKRQAAMIVKGILREDSNNADAWWLMANILDDEEKVVKALERVLKFKPDHPGARRKLASMRPEYANLAPSPFDSDVKKSAPPMRKQTSGSGGMIAIVAGVVVLIFGAIGAVALSLSGIDGMSSGNEVIYSATIDLNSDDVHELSMNESGVFNITADGTSGFDSQLFVYGEDDFLSLIAQNDDHDNYSGLDRFDSAIENVRIGDGVFISVEELFGDSGSVTLRVTRGNENAIQEGTMSVGESRTERLASGSALEFVINSSARVDIEVVSDDVDPIIVVFNDDGQVIGYDDDSGNGLDARIANLQLSGRTIIHIRDYWNNSSDDVTVTVE